MAGPFAKAARNAMRDGETSADAVARFVRRLIFEGALTPGQRLPQDDIAEAVGVSRIPVREAIIALEREGWLQVERHRGAFVTVFDDQAVLDRFALYGRFYGFAARRALARMSGDELASLGVLAAGLARRSSAAAFDRANTLYISTLVNLSGSNRLRAILRSTAQIVPGNFFSTVPNSIAIQREEIIALQAALDLADAALADRICARMENRHALQVIEIMHARRLSGARS